MNRTVPEPAQLLTMKAQALDALYGRCESGPVPNGRADGTALIATGTGFAPPIALFARLFAWKGKTVTANDCARLLLGQGLRRETSGISLLSTILTGD